MRLRLLVLVPVGIVAIVTAVLLIPGADALLPQPMQFQANPFSGDSPRVALLADSNISVADGSAGANSAITVDMEIPEGRSFPDSLALGIPSAWDISGWAKAEPGTVIGTIEADVHVGVANGPCDMPVHAEFTLLAAAVDGEPVSSYDTAAGAQPGVPDVFEFVDDSKIPRGVSHIPDFLSAYELPGESVARAYAQSNVNSWLVYVNLVTQNLGDDGIASYLFIGNPTIQSPVVTSLCSPVKSRLTLFGTSPTTSVPLLKNPSEGDYEWRVLAAPPPDSDEDGVDNKLDNCPLSANSDQLDADADSMGNSCDPTEDTNLDGGDADADGYLNGSDVCPLVSDPEQQDLDGDGIGEACAANGAPAAEPLVVTQVISISAAADQEVVPTPVDIASLPSIYKPFEAQDPTFALDPADAPSQQVGDDSLAPDPSACTAGQSIIVASSGWSVCHDDRWSYYPQRRWVNGLWEESFVLTLRAVGSAEASGDDPVVLAEIAITHQLAGRGLGTLLPGCENPRDTDLGGLTASVCEWDSQDSPVPGIPASVHYVNFRNGRIALEAVARDPTGQSAIDAVLQTFRLPQE